MVWVELSYTLNPSAISFTAVAFATWPASWLLVRVCQWRMEGPEEGRSHVLLASGAVSGRGRCRNGNSGSRRWTLGFHPDILVPGGASLATQRPFPFCFPGFLQLLIFR